MEPSIAEIERLTITLPAEVAAVVKSAVETGDYASTSEVIRSALRDWETKRALRLEELAALKSDIDFGVAAGRYETSECVFLHALYRQTSHCDLSPKEIGPTKTMRIAQVR